MTSEAKKPSPTWCVLPWIHLFVGESGALRPCCMTLEDPAMVNRDEDGNPCLVYAPEGIEAAWNSGFMREMRRDMLAGRRPAACSRCFRDEDLGIRSHRHLSNTLFAKHRAEALQHTTPDGASPTELICSLDIRLGNRCNLKCRMCSPVSSRAMLSDYAALYDLARNDERLLKLAGIDWVAKPEFLHTFEACATRAERLHFSGGEPLLMPEMTSILEGLIERGQAPGIELHFVTNLTILPERMFELWVCFKSLGMVVSLDAIGALAEYIRYPLRWPEVDRNLKILDARAASINCNSLHLNVTVQVYNVLALDELVTYSVNELPHFGRPKLSLLYYPEAFNIQVLPPEVKQLASERLARLAKRLRAGWPGHWPAEETADLIGTIEGIIEHMNSADRSDLLPEFRRWTEILDASRGEDVQTAIPELSPLFDYE
jgi:hypothetical protein